MNAGPAGDTVVVGRILGPWGVQGWARVYSWTDPPEALFDYQPWYLGASQQAVSLSDWRRSGKRLLARLAEFDSPEALAALVDAPILVARDQLPEPPAGQYYWHDLVGLEVVNLQGFRWGTVTGFLPTGVHDVMKIATEDQRQVLIPFVIGRFVHEVDPKAQRIRVDWPEEWEG
ncbi:MAG: ribosome maturation factor RimM [Wenzhouxiangella sp.]